MKVCIVIAAYNAEHYLAETLESVLAQTYQDWEAVVVDDGSQDGTYTVAQQYVSLNSQIKVLHQENQGVGNARNAGIAVAPADTSCFAFLDSDDVWEPDALTLLMQQMQAHPDAVGCHGLARNINENSLPFLEGELEKWGSERYRVDAGKLVLSDPEEPTTLAHVAYRGCFLPSNSIVRRSALEKVGLFDQKFAPQEDMHLWYRLLLHGDFRVVNRVVCNYRRHSANASSSDKTGKQNWAARLDVLASARLTQEQRKTIKEGMRLWRRYLVMQRLRWAGEATKQGNFANAARQIRHSLHNVLFTHTSPT